MPISIKTIVGSALLMTTIGSITCAQGQLADSAAARPRIAFADTDGAEHTLPCKAELRGMVLVFISTDCPIANAYQPTLRRLREEFSESRFDFVMVHTDAELKLDAARKHKREYDIAWPIVLDPGNKLARRVSAKVTPEAIIVDAMGKVQYRGRIDDRHESYGRKRPEPTTHDLHSALRAIAEGKPVQVSETKPIGCVIRYAD
jgi:Redoxin